MMRTQVFHKGEICMRCLFLFVVLVLACSVFALSESQTDWVGGPGIQGPVTDWQNRFYIADDMDWETTPGQLQLIVDRSENLMATANGPTYVQAVDMDQDGDLDAAACAYVSGEVFWMENTNGLGTAWTKHLIGVVSTPRFLTVADFDGNGLRDIAVSSDQLDKIVYFPNSPSGWGADVVIATNFDARQIRTADVNEDGHPDIVGVSSISGDVCWWQNNHPGTWTQNYIDGALMGAYTCDVGDFNNDGHFDVVAASNSENDIVAYISQAPYGFSWHKDIIATSYASPVSVAVADYNGDGNDDFAIASSAGDGNLFWYDFLDTQSTWIAHDMVGAGSQGVYDISAIDMDGDGFADITLASYAENKIAWCKNREYLGQNWETFGVSTYFAGALGVSAGDMDGDNVPDVMGCAYIGDKISWWRVSGFTSPSSLTSSIMNIEPPNPGSVLWVYLNWSSTTPDETGVRVRLRTSYTSGDMGPWSVWLTEPASLASVVAQGGQYLQYEVELYTNNPNTTPSLKDIDILWNPVSIADGASSPVDGRKIWIPSGNPVSGCFTVGYKVEQPGYVSIAVYDVTGRTVSVIGDGEMAAGEYSAMITDLPAGSYAIVMQSPSGFTAQRVVVVR
jgi:hypothetical protein